MRKNMTEWRDTLLASSKRESLPIMTYPGLEYTNETVFDLVTKGESQSKCIRALAENYPTLASVMVMDLSVEVEAFGAEVNFHRDDIPDIINTLVHDSQSIKNLQVPEIGTGRTSQYIKAAELASHNISNKPVFAGSIGPFSLAVRLFDMTEFMTFALIDPNAAHQLISKANDFLINYIHAYKEAGANGIVIAEPAAGLLSPEMCDAFSSEYVKQIVESVQDKNFSIILHNCGYTENLVESMLSTKAFGYHFGNSVNMVNILKQIPKDIPVMGNLDPVTIFRNGTVQHVQDSTLKLLDETKNYPNYIISSGCDIPPGSSKENIEAFFDVIAVINRN